MYNVDFLQYALAKGVGEAAIKKALNFLKLNKNASWKDIITDKSILKLKDDIYTNIYKTENEAKILAEQLYNDNIYMILENDLMYPERLKNTLGNNTPPVIFVQGNLALLNKNSIGFCGSRKVSDKGKQIAYECAKELVNNDITVVSGYASGTDLTAHMSALSNNGNTIFVIPEGILKKRIKGEVKNYLNNTNHVFISQFMPNLTWNAMNAMRRNKVIIGLSIAMILIESRRDGGTFEAGKETLKLGHKLFVVDFFHPPETAEANKFFISQGGIPIKKNRDGHPSMKSVFNSINNDMSLLNKKISEPEFDFTY
ncbi:DNA-processing protein DprA [uncultured Brachyspira sp.]|uniref:DNA-processing protein DprA n=1 Tax=uncultured Brachyspira sp. TaxID=221953 RepID=UPI0026228CF6|nr:DNA-processing protein DprA [uncultured Brachyspira sp.]